MKRDTKAGRINYSTWSETGGGCRAREGQAPCDLSAEYRAAHVSNFHNPIIDTSVTPPFSTLGNGRNKGASTCRWQDRNFPAAEENAFGLTNKLAFVTPTPPSKAIHARHMFI